MSSHGFKSDQNGPKNFLTTYSVATNLGFVMMTTFHESITASSKPGFMVGTPLNIQFDVDKQSA